MMTTHDDKLANNQTNLNNAIFFSHGYSLKFFSHFCSFMVVLGFGDEVLCWVFGVGVFSGWGFGPPGLFGLELSI